MADLEERTKAALHEVLGQDGDETILEYLAGVLCDEHFPWDEAFDHVGDIMISSGCCTGAEEAQAACDKLAERLDPRRAGAADAAPSRVPQALSRGPVTLAEADTRTLLHAIDAVSMRAGKDLIQATFTAGGEASSGMTAMTEKDKAKLEKRAAKEEAAARAAFEAQTARAMSAASGSKPTIRRNAGGGGSRDVHLENFSVSNGGKDLIEDATVMFAHGRRYGLIGRNGTGKTTFLRALASGEIKGLPPNCQVLHVEQEVVGDDTPVIEAVLECDVERSELLAEEAELMAALKITERPGEAAAADGPVEGSKADGAVAAETASKTASSKAAAATAAVGGNAPPDEGALSERLNKVWRRLTEIDADGAEARAASILAGLSFEPDMMRRATKTFSGGWRMRVALARALFVEPDLLLLDEPTNHLDLFAVLWLEDYLVRWPKTLLVVSHAREFLNAVCTDILHLHSRSVTTWKGNYDAFVRASEEKLKNDAKAAEAAEMKRAHVQAFIDKFRYNAKRASLVQSRIKALERMAEVRVVERDPEYVFNFPDPGSSAISPPIIGFNDVDFAYAGGRTLFRALNFGLDLDSRAAIVGPNGIGKSTLLGLISGTLEPVKGYITRNPGVRMAVFSQHHVDGMDLALSPLGIMLKAYPNLKEQEARSHLGSFGVSGPLALQPLYTLSGGQKSRVAFAKLTFTKPHLLLLDEPSNHLDIDAVDALIEGLAMFKGGVLMVSHDQYLIESTVNELWMCENQTIVPFHGEFEDYKKRLRAGRTA